MKRTLLLYAIINSIIIVSLSAYLMLIPAVMVINGLCDQGLYSAEIPHFVYKWHQKLSPRYEEWARERVASGTATNLTTANVSGTEWPVFGSVFYLWATESLQEAYQENPALSPEAPKEYARGAIEAAAELVADPNHAKWVIDYWGDDYLEKENLFYRMLLISGLTSYQKLTDKTTYEILLRNQVESLADELDKSPFGLLDDYPGYCYPVDIVPAIAAIRRADSVLGTDHSEFVERAVRGFQGDSLDEETGLPSYIVDSKTGQALDSARGVGLSFMLIWAPELWPEVAKDWYDKYQAQFWQQSHWFAGFREYPVGIDTGFFYFNDVDAGPVLAGYGAAASAFGIGASRALGRFDHAYALAGQALVGIWPLPNGTLMIPRLLSDISDAPYLGESAVLFALTRKPVMSDSNIERGNLPGIVYLGIALFIILGIFEILTTILKTFRLIKPNPKFYIPIPIFQVVVWPLLIVTAIVSWNIINCYIGFVVLLTSQIIPVCIKRKKVKKRV